MGKASSEAEREVAWAAHPGGQQLVLSCTIHEILVEGNRGGGKTDVALAKFLKYVGKGFGSHWRGVCFRREYKHLDDLVIKSKRFFKHAFPNARFLGSKSDYKWIFPDGEELLFRRIKDASGYWDFHGHEYPFVHFEELTNWPDDGAWESMKSCCRASIKGVPKVYMANTNPYGAGHTWVKELFIKPDIDGDEVPWGTVMTDDKGNKRVRIHLALDENKDLIEADPDYKKRLAAIGNDNLRQAWLHGNWDIVVGGFLQGIWDHDKHIVDDFDIPREWPRWRAMDWGFARPFSVGWYCMDEDGIIYRYRELYGYGGKANRGTREDIGEIANQILKLETMERKAGIEFRNNIADSAIWAEQGGLRRDGRELTIGELSSKAGVKWIPCKKGPGSRKSGAQVVIHYLKEGKFKVFRSCKHFIRTVPVLMPDENDWDDVDTEQEDHCFSGDTKVITKKGIVKIHDLVGTSGEVWSVGGWQSYENCRPTKGGAISELVEVRFNDGYTVCCTPDHRFITDNKQWIEAKDMAGKLILRSSKTPFRSSTEGGFTNAENISQDSLKRQKESGFIALYGNTITEKYQTITKCITKTMTSAIMPYQTFPAFRVPCTGSIMRSTETCMSMVLCQVQQKKRLSGTVVKKAKSGILNILKNTYGRYIQINALQKNVLSVAGHSKQLNHVRPVPSIALEDVNRLCCVSVTPKSPEPVFCLTVPETGVFALENGVLVSNCWDEFRYSLVSRHKPFTRKKKESGIKPGTFDWLTSLSEPKAKHPLKM